MNIHQAQKYIVTDLEPIYGEREAKNMANMLLETVLNCTNIHLVLNSHQVLTEKEQNRIQEALKELVLQKPIQYVLGEADFYDLKFKVNKHTLIPRPETEELVHKIIADCNNLSPQILDIGTGSGCIPIALAKHIRNALISSVDISAEAIAVAKENAENNVVRVEFLHRDILNWQNYSWEHYDIIVSNPPYVCNSEKAQMSDNVLAYEPHSALFVEDDNPLIFYIAIADFAKQYLNDKGKIYLEINENLGQETLQMLSDKGFVNLQLLQDINGRNRMVVAEKNIIR